MFIHPVWYFLSFEGFIVLLGDLELGSRYWFAFWDLLGIDLTELTWCGRGEEALFVRTWGWS